MAQIKGPLPGVYISSGRYYRQIREGKKKRWLPLSRVDEGIPALHRALAALMDQPPPPTDSMEALINRWYAAELPRLAPKTQADARRYCEIIRGSFGAFRAPEVSTPDVVQWLTACKDQPRLYNAWRAAMRELMRYAELIGWRPAGSNPTAAIRTARIPARTRYITDSELRRLKIGAMYHQQHGERLVNDSGPTMCALIEVLYLTGQAIGDVLALDAVDVTGDRVVFRRAKVARTTGAAVAVLVTPRLRAALDQLLSIRADVIAATRKPAPALIVTQAGGRYTYNGIKSAWRRALERSGIQDAHIHDLKAKALTDLERERGMREARVLGQHATETQTAAYVRARSAAAVRAVR